MSFEYKIVSSPGNLDFDIIEFISANDHDFYPPISTRRNLKEFVQLVYDHSGIFVLCFSENKIIGLTSVYLNHPSYIAYYHYVAIDKKFRGLGISTVLYNEVHKICKNYGIHRAIVKTWSTNQVSQAMFKKHGFFHLEILEDDRSKGIHTYFFAKSFYDYFLKQPMKCLGIIGSNDIYALGSFVKTLFSIPKNISKDHMPIPVTVVFDTLLNNDLIRLNQLVGDFENKGITHCIFIDDSFSIHSSSVEMIDVFKMTCDLLSSRKRNYLLVADLERVGGKYAIDNVFMPGKTDQKIIDNMIHEIRTGKISAPYFKKEMAIMAAASDCKGILIGSPELHAMYGYDKAYEGIEIFDPLIELAIIIQDSWIKNNA